MKVYDMLGSGVPVCAVHYPTIGELVKSDVNGLIFKSHQQLSAQLIRLLVNPAHTFSGSDVTKDDSFIGTNALSVLKAGTKTGLTSWDVNWNKVMPAVLKGYL